MKIKEVIRIIENWAPPGAAWEKDNIGLQVGDENIEVAGILLALELNLNVLKEAIKKKCNLIITHHPFIFTPIKKLNFSKDEKSFLISELIKNNVALFSAHTNLDFTIEGVSFQLAKQLQLQNISFLENEKSNQYKVVVFVPESHLEKVSNAAFNSGAGIIGNYDSCSFRSSGNGTFRGNEKSNPTIGEKQNFETVEEVRLEFLVDKWKLNKVIKAIEIAHPYEEVAMDIYNLENRNVNYGYGAIGELKKALSKNEFLKHVSKRLKIKNFRYTNGKSSKIKKVAVCGGSGSDLLNMAIANRADAFITADIKYHTFQDAENKILFIDAGHYETEIFILDEIKKRIEKIADNKFDIIKYSKSTNPVKYYNNIN